MFRVIRITNTPDNQNDEIIVLPGSYDGTKAARESISEPGDYFLIKTFNIKKDGIKGTGEDNSGSAQTSQTTAQTGMEGGNSESQQDIQQGSAGENDSSTSKETEGSSTKKAATKSGTKKAATKSSTSAKAKNK